MVKILLELKEPLNYVRRNTNHHEFKSIYFDSLDWFILTELKKIFEIFVMPSIKLQGQVYTTMPKALLYVFKIYKDLDLKINYFELQRENNEELVSLKNTI